MAKGTILPSAPTVWWCWRFLLPQTKKTVPTENKTSLNRPKKHGARRKTQKKETLKEPASPKHSAEEPSLQKVRALVGAGAALLWWPEDEFRSLPSQASSALWSFTGLRRVGHHRAGPRKVAPPRDQTPIRCRKAFPAAAQERRQSDTRRPELGNSTPRRRGQRAPGHLCRQCQRQRRHTNKQSMI